MTRLDYALALAVTGFYVFPLVKGSKVPAVSDWPNKATRDHEKINNWFDHGNGNDYNIGIATEKFGDDQALVVVDVDQKNGKDGYAEIFRLELEGHEFPPTLEQATPSGGRHLVYVSPLSCRQGVDTLGIGLDIRSRGGYIVGAGSVIDGRAYEMHEAPLARAPQWLVNRLGIDRSVRAIDRAPVAGVDVQRAWKRATDYLATAPLAREGEGGDVTAYKVAAQLKDFGCTDEQTLEILLEHWNDRCEPPWDVDELAAKVAHAYRYGKEPPGIDAPEAVFSAAPAPPAADDTGLHPFEKLNQEYAFVISGGGHYILWETENEYGYPVVEFIKEGTFHKRHAAQSIQTGKKSGPLTEAWMESATRRTYDKLVFCPEQAVAPRFYNLWRGFTVEALPDEETPDARSTKALDAWFEHVEKNLCGGDKTLTHWLVGYFAHMVQRPWEKPLVALVFRGKKGTGKNAAVERVGSLFKSNMIVTDDNRYLVGNFNSHLESCLLLVLDEAHWAGDKRAEGKLKGLITGSEHVIERKGAEPYKVANRTRVVIIGNEDWLAPATEDERRFAVFNVGEGRKQDRKFFQEMREGMEAGGYRLLLRFLRQYDASDLELNEAPNTQGLVDQKIASLDIQAQWWYDCLREGQILGGDFGGEWPATLPTNRLRAAFDSYARKRNVRGWTPNEQKFGKELARLAPSVGKKPARPANDTDTSKAYVLPNVEVLRKEFEATVGGECSWDEC